MAISNKYLDIYIQGVASNDPGYAGIGLVMNGERCQELSEYIGVATPLQAKYQAIIRALGLIYNIAYRLKICVYSDDKSLVRDMYRLHCPELNLAVASLHKCAYQKSRPFQVRYICASSDDPHICRATKLANQAMLERREATNSKDNFVRDGLERHALQQSAGGVVYKRKKKLLQVCLIAKKNGQIWALPKGRMQPGESWEGTAMREILEETGHLASIAGFIDQIDYYFYWKENHTIYYKIVAFFLMPLVVENHRPPDGEADTIDWFTMEEAINKLHYQSEKNILRQAKIILNDMY